MSLPIDAPPIPDIGPIGTMRVRVGQAQADAMLRLLDKGQLFTSEEFADALGVQYERAKKFLRNAFDRDLVTVTKDGKIWRRK